MRKRAVPRWRRLRRPRSPADIDLHRPLTDNTLMSRRRKNSFTDAPTRSSGRGAGYRLCMLVVSVGTSLGAGSAFAESTRAALIETLATDVAPSAAFKTHIAQGIGFRQTAYERLRRALLLCRSPLVKGPRPAFFEPTVARATTQLIPTVERLAVSADGGPQASVRLLRELILASYSDDELSELDWYFRSTNGKRVLKILETARAIEVLDAATTDVNSGLRLQWPIAHVLAYMKEVGFQSEFLAAVERVRPGVSRLLPMLTGEMDQLLTTEAQEALNGIDWGSTGSEWLAGLPPEDVRRVTSPRISRYLRNQSAAHATVFSILPPHSTNSEKSPNQVAQEMCDRVAQKSCPADIVARVHTFRSTWLDAQGDELAEFRKMAMKFPGSYCAGPQQPVSPTK